MGRFFALLVLGVGAGALAAYVTQSPAESDAERGKRLVFFAGVFTMLFSGGYYGFRTKA